MKTKFQGRNRTAILAAAVVLAMAGPAGATALQVAHPLDLPLRVIAITSDRCIQLEQQFDTVAGDHETNPNLPLAQSYRDKGSYLCNNDVEDIGEEQLERALRLLGVEPDPVP